MTAGGIPPAAETLALTRACEFDVIVHDVKLTVEETTKIPPPY
jgi:hypothetical protein